LACQVRLVALEGIAKAELLRDLPVELLAPIVEIAGQEHRVSWQAALFHDLGHLLHLRRALPLVQAQVHVEHVQRTLGPGHAHVQRTAPLDAIGGDVVVFEAPHAQARECGVAVVPNLAKLVAAVVRVEAQLLRQVRALGAAGARAVEDLLAQHDVHRVLAQRSRHLRHRHAAAAVGPLALADVVREYVDAVVHGLVALRRSSIPL
jgi:hypothetical protein